MTFSSAWWKSWTGFDLALFCMVSSAPYTMRSATDFLPCFMIEFMNLDRTRSLYFGSGLISRLSALCRRDIFSFLRQSFQASVSFGFLNQAFLADRDPGFRRDTERKRPTWAFSLRTWSASASCQPHPGCRARRG